MLRRFLDGILDDRARFQVEYVKEPDDIDDAVFEVVNFLETKKRTNTDSQDRKVRKPVRAVNNSQSSEAELVETGSDADEEEIRAVAAGKNTVLNRVTRNQVCHARIPRILIVIL